MSLSVKAFFFAVWPPADISQSTEIRRFVVDDGATTSLTYLLHKLANVFQWKRTDDLSVRWRDVDGDFIDVKTDEDLLEALSANAGDVFKIYVSRASSASSPGPAPAPHYSQPSPRSSSTTGEQVHINIICDGCQGRVKGSRFKCTFCYDYDLCSTCETRGLHAEHPMIRLRNPVTGPGSSHGSGSTEEQWLWSLLGPIFEFGFGGQGRGWGPAAGGCRRGGRRDFSGNPFCFGRRPEGHHGPPPSCRPGFGFGGQGFGGYQQGCRPQGHQQQQQQSGTGYGAPTGGPGSCHAPTGGSGSCGDSTDPQTTAECQQSFEEPSTSSSAAAPFDEEKYQECMDRLTEFGFRDDSGWLKDVVRECNGEVSLVLDRIDSMYKQHHDA